MTFGRWEVTAPSPGLVCKVTAKIDIPDGTPVIGPKLDAPFTSKEPVKGGPAKISDWSMLERNVDPVEPPVRIEALGERDGDQVVLADAGRADRC